MCSTSTQNAAAPDSDEEDDLSQLQVIEQKLLAHDPTFTAQETHASMATQRSALMSAFRPSYNEGDIEGVSLLLTYEKSRTNHGQATREFISIPNDGGYARHIFHQ